METTHILESTSAAAGEASPARRVSGPQRKNSRYSHRDTSSAWDAIEKLTRANVDKPTITRMMGGNAWEQFGLDYNSTLPASIIPP